MVGIFGLCSVQCDTGLEDGNRLTNFEDAITFHGNGHDFSVETEVVKLAAIAPPSWLYSACCRYLPFAPGCIWKRLNDNLKDAGLVRIICQPPSVGRELGMDLVER